MAVAEFKTITAKHFYNVDDTLKLIERLSTEYAFQVRELASELYSKSNSDLEFLENIWNYIRIDSGIEYVHDDHEREKKGEKNLHEQVRRPIRTIEEKKGDCDCFTTLIRAILNNTPHIKHTSKATAYPYYEEGELKYPKKGEFQHVYPVAFLPDGKIVVIDCVPEIPYFGYEAKNIINQKFYPNMALQELSGIGNEVTEVTEDEVHGFLGGLNVSDVPENNDDIPTTLSALVDTSVLAELNNQKDVFEKAKNDPDSVIGQSADIDNELLIINNVIDNFNVSTEARFAAFDKAINSNSMFIDYYNTLLEMLQDSENTRVSGLDTPVYVGKIKLFKKLTTFVKNKVVPVLKKPLSVLKKVSPLLVTTRASVLVALKTNAGNYAKKIAYGYMTESEAKAKNLNMAEWAKFAAATKKAEDHWVKVLGGDRSAFKKAVMTGRGAKAAGMKGLNSVIVTAAVKGIGFVINAFKGLKLKKVNPKEETDESDASESVNVDPQGNVTDPIDTTTTTEVLPEKTNTENPTQQSWFAKNKKMIIIGSVVGGLIILVIILVVYFSKKKKKEAAKRKRLNGAARQRKQLKGYVGKEHPTPYTTKVVYSRQKPHSRVRRKKNSGGGSGVQTKLFINGLDGAKGKKGSKNGMNPGMRASHSRLKSYKKAHPKASHKAAVNACKSR